MASSGAEPARCPVCWTPVRAGARRCPACRADLARARSVVAGASLTGQRGGRLVPRAHFEPGRPLRLGPWLAAAVAAAALITAAAIKVIGDRLPPPAEYGAATGNVAAPVPVSPATAARALFAFQPAGDVETVGTALAYATADRPDLSPGSAHIVVRPGPGGSEIVSVSLPVDVAFLRQVHAIQTGFGPNPSDLAKGRLYINAADDNAYGIVMNPRTRIAVFSFRLSGDDRTIWPLDLNALQVVSQTQSLG